MWYTYQSILHYLPTYEDEGGGENGDSATSKGSIRLGLSIGL